MKDRQKARVARIDRLTGDIMDLRLKKEEGPGAILEAADPGQFIGLYPPGGDRLLMRPISICDVEGEEVRLVFRVAGGGTRALSLLRPGDGVFVLGPLGRGFPIEEATGKRVVLIGGGVGIPPLLYTARRLDALGGGTLSVAVLGYRDRETFLAGDFLPTHKEDLFLATEDGSLGCRGNVIDALKEGDISGDLIFACGPSAMLRGVKHFAEERGIPAYLSLEERMACGIGACLGCVTKTKELDAHSLVHNARVCTEGPVFPAEAVLL